MFWHNKRTYRNIISQGEYSADFDTVYKSIIFQRVVFNSQSTFAISLDLS